MRKPLFILIISAILLCIIIMQGCNAKTAGVEPCVKNEDGVLKLPDPEHDSDVSVERALYNRRSVREFNDEPVTLDEISQVCWAAQGITDNARSLRTAPSAGALYPLEVYIVSGDVSGLLPGVYRYMPEVHGLTRIVDGDKRIELCAASLSQSSILEAPACLVFSAFYKKTTQKYGERGIQYVHLEAGHAAQNVFLQVVSLGLGTVTIGAFNDSEVRELLKMLTDEQPLYIMPIGRVASK